MKILSFKLDGQVKFGPKVKKEEAVWDVLKIQQELQVFPSFPSTIIDGISLGFDFVEQIRKLVDAAQQSDRTELFKHTFSNIEWLSPIPRTPKNIMCIGKNYDEHAKEMGAEKPSSMCGLNPLEYSTATFARRNTCVTARKLSM